MLKLKEICPHEWEFVYPEEYNRIMDYFHSGCEVMEEGNWEEVEEVFRKVLKEMPDHLDALHHLAMIKEEGGRWEREPLYLGTKFYGGNFNEPDKYGLKVFP